MTASDTHGRVRPAGRGIDNNSVTANSCRPANQAGLTATGIDGRTAVVQTEPPVAEEVFES
jgi:hypothetical protein